MQALYVWMIIKGSLMFIKCLKVKKTDTKYILKHIKYTRYAAIVMASNGHRDRTMNIHKLDGVAPLITEPPRTSFIQNDM